MLPTKTITEIRVAVKAIFGRANAKVTRNGEVHVHGVVPNTNIVAWYLLGFVGQIELDERLWLPDGELNYSISYQ